MSSKPQGAQGQLVHLMAGLVSDSHGIRVQDHQCM